MDKFPPFLGVVVSATIGAIASLPFHKEIDTLPKRAFAVAVSAAGANYIAPLAIEYFHITPTQSGGIAFLIGLFGLSMVQAVMRGFTNADLWGLIRSRFGRGE